MTHMLGMGPLVLSLFQSLILSIFAFSLGKWKEERYSYNFTFSLSQRGKWEGSCVSERAYNLLGVEQVTEQLNVWLCMCVRRNKVEIVPQGEAVIVVLWVTPSCFDDAVMAAQRTSRQSIQCCHFITSSCTHCCNCVLICVYVRLCVRHREGVRKIERKDQPQDE